MIHGAEHREAVLATLRSIAGLSSYTPERFTVVVLGDAPADPAALPLEVAYAASVDGFDLGTAADGAYVELIPAGLEYSPDAFDVFFADAAAGSLARCYIHREGAYAYRLNRTVGREDRGPVTLDDADRLWAGSTPALVPLDVFRACSSDARTGGDPNLLFAEAILATGGFSVLGGKVTSPQQHEDALYGEQRLFTPDWYLGFLTRWVALLERVAAQPAGAPPYLQRVFLYLAQLRLQYNVDRHNKNALDEAQLAEFAELLARGLAAVSDEEIIGAVRKPLGYRRSMVAYLLKAKHRAAFSPRAEIDADGRDVVVTVNGHEVERLSEVRLAIDVMDSTRDELIVSGLVQSLYLTDRLALTARVGGTDLPLPDSGVYSEFSVFGELQRRQPTFTARIPRSLLAAADRIEFVATFTEKTAAHASTGVPLRLNFRRPSAKLSDVPGSYWIACGRLLRAQPSGIAVGPAGALQRLKAELRLQRRLLGGERVERSAALLRLVYFATRPWYRFKRDWIYYDRIILAGDNAEYAYDYAAAQRDGIRKNYVLAADSAPATRFREQGKPFLPHKTLTHRLRFLNAELVFATHLKPATRNAFSWNEQFFRDLFGYRVVYINHGLVLDDLSYSLNKHAENQSRMCVVSHFETETLSDPSYGFARDEIIETGFARYDGLESRPTRDLLLAPTWRYYLNRPQDADRLQGHNEEFTESDYFKVYNGVINNPRLHRGLEEHGYTLTYLLHPNTSSHVDDYRSSSDRVRILAPQNSPGYERMLSESDLMITDYSGVQFDFAYMTKPVLYYHHPSIPPHYRRGAFSYEEHGFGEVATDEETLVDTLLDYLAQECRMPEAYRARVDAFFTHRDRDNSKRIYEAGHALLRERSG
ncbi:CDP-glycerol glycerophosphotransferase family protein [Leucobacter soli]|nr:CDP-glycerol glycerophosphotransferase family protein [Leucobacter soli]